MLCLAIPTLFLCCSCVALVLFSCCAVIVLVLELLLRCYCYARGVYHVVFVICLCYACIVRMLLLWFLFPMFPLLLLCCS